MSPYAYLPMLTHLVCLHTLTYQSSIFDMLVQCLEDAPAGDLIAVMMSPPFGDTFQTDAAAPTIDGIELTDTIAALSRNASNIPIGIDLLAGANLDEGTEFMNSESLTLFFSQVERRKAARDAARAVRCPAALCLAPPPAHPPRAPHTRRARRPPRHCM